MRDASYIIGLNASSDAPIAFTLMGDGIDWKPVLWFAKRLRGLPVVMLYHHVLPQVTYCAESPGAFVAAVVDLLLSAVERPMWPTDWLSCDAKLTLSSGASMEVIRVLGTLRHAVVAVKVVDLWAAERLAPPRSPVTSLHEEIGDRVIFMNEVGEPLDLVCLCDDKKRKMIAGIVARDIRQFLDKLIEIGCGMVDLHPGNIVMVSDGTEMHAKVIDIESITALGTVFKGVARRSFFTLGADLKPTRETELLGLLLVVAWIVDWNSTRSAVNRDEWSRAEVALALAKLVANEKALNEIVPELKLINDK